MDTHGDKVIVPIIVDLRGAKTPPTSPPASERGDADECFVVIYRKPTIRQAGAQFWTSLKLLTRTVRCCVSGYLGNINRSHNAIYRCYNCPDDFKRNRS